MTAIESLSMVSTEMLWYNSSPFFCSGIIYLVMVIWNLLPLGHELMKCLELGGGVSVPVSC